MTNPRSLLHDGQRRDSTSFEYIIVGSGAGGGPLACRLASAGKRVLLIEAGADPANAKPSAAYPNAGIGEVTRVPGYYAAASEDAELSWMFSVRHYADTARQELDQKYNQTPLDPNRAPGTTTPLDPKYLDPHPNGGKQGIFYPRSSGLGGCTAHHAMIIIRPNGKDWNYIADLTGDDSWRADRMRGYFAKMERCLYIEAYNRFFRNLLGIIYKVWRWLVLLFDPRAFVDNGGHGFDGWQPTSFIDPFLIETIEKTDRPFFSVIVRSALSVLHSNHPLIGFFKQALVRLRVVQQIDFNDVNTRRASPEGVFLIPIGTESEVSEDQVGQVLPGRREGVREFVLRTAKSFPDKLVIATGVHVTKVLFDKITEGGTPRAIGIEGVRGHHLYEASPAQQPVPQNSEVRYFTTGEVVLCGGAFNTPQLLMLSGIGDRAHLADHDIHYLSGADGRPLGKDRTNRDGNPLPAQGVIDLPGVGSNMQDRYEVTVVSELDKDFSTLDGISFQPGDAHDPARQTWLRGEKGLYATNGGTLAIINRSSVLSDDEREPDLFTFAASAAFRGYYWNWSRELFRRTLGADQDEHKLWSWVILKAYTHNNAGTVRLRSANPFEMPEICFHSFDETPGDGWKRDLQALVDGVRFMRRINARNPSQFVREIQPGPEITDGSPELEEWIKTQAWGHHACGTCRIGSDVWQADPEKLNDRMAVLDSHFRVHGVNGLRVVDASVFPKIPGYFILAPIFMISEKAADTMIEDSKNGANDRPRVKDEGVYEPEPSVKRIEEIEPAEKASASATLAPIHQILFRLTELRLPEKLDAIRKTGVAWLPPRRKHPEMRRYRIWFSPQGKAWRAFSTLRARSTALTIPIEERGFSVEYPIEPLGHTQGNIMDKHSSYSSDECYQGSTEFYNTPETDPFTPSYGEAKPLADNVAKPWGIDEYGQDILPPWIVKGSNKSPSLQYVEWFNGIWHTGDPSSWNREVFTNTATTIDPSGITRGADQCAGNFSLLFKYFPELRGEVVSWAANDRELFINWRFRVRNKRDRLPIGPITQFLHDQQAGRDFLVPVVDKFCFDEGRVSYRLATFDVITFIGYLSDNYGQDELYDFLIAYFWQATFGGGVALLPRMFVNLFLGFFYWPPAPPQGLYARPGDGIVRLQWDPIENAVAYRVTRATAIAGNYVSPRPDGKAVVVNEPTRNYDDLNVQDGTAYWYLVSPIKEKWRPVEVAKDRLSYHVTH